MALPISAHRVATVLLLFALLTPLLTPQESQAHRLNVFAARLDDTVRVSAGFSKGHPAIKAAVTVTDDTTKTLLLTGTTDTQGIFTFPWKTLSFENGLLITVNAGEGHVNSWQIPQDVFRNSEPSRAQATAPEDLRELIRAEIRTSLAPLVQELAEERAFAQPGFKEIFGGLGWIVGITGLIFGWHERKKRRTQQP